MNFVSQAISAAEILETAAKLESNEDKVEYLSKYVRKDIRFLVELMYVHDLKGLYIPEYTPLDKPYTMAFMTLGTAIAKIKAALVYRENKPVYEKNLIRVLESVTKEEAALLVHVLTGKKIEGISKATFKKVYPEFFRSGE